MKAPTPAKAPRQKRSKPDVPLSPSDMRRSSRPRSEVNYAEDLRPARGAGGAAAEPKDYTERIAAVQLDEATAERLRLEAEARRAEKAKQAGEAKQQRGPIDSGKGVRVQVCCGKPLAHAHWARDRCSLTLSTSSLQGGKVYDSKFGVTCHWCVCCFAPSRSRARLFRPLSLVPTASFLRQKQKDSTPSSTPKPTNQTKPGAARRRSRTT